MSYVIDKLIDEAFERADIHESFNIMIEDEIADLFILENVSLTLRIEIKHKRISNHEGIITYILRNRSKLFGMSDPIWSETNAVVIC